MYIHLNLFAFFRRTVTSPSSSSPRENGCGSEELPFVNLESAWSVVVFPRQYCHDASMMTIFLRKLPLKMIRMSLFSNG